MTCVTASDIRKLGRIYSVITVNIDSPRIVDVSVIIPTYGSRNTLPRTLDALLRSRYPAEGFELIVVHDGQQEAVSSQFDKAQEQGPLPALVHLSQDHKGAAAARNLGAKHARGELLIFIDDDMIVGPDFIEQIVTDWRSHGNCLINGAWQFTPEVESTLQNTPFGRYRIELEEWIKGGIHKEHLENDFYRASALTAADLAVPKSVFEKLGGFDEFFPMAGCEDQEFSCRAADAGYPMFYDGTIHLYHNDHRMTLREFGLRHEQGAITAVYLAATRHELATRPLITRNRKIQLSDPWLEVLKKSIKTALSSTAVLNTVDVVIEKLEPIVRHDRFLRHLFRLSLAIHIFRGVRKGETLLAKQGKALP
jgi:GT2 family glycosyltransferase